MLERCKESPIRAYQTKIISCFSLPWSSSLGQILSITGSVSDLLNLSVVQPQLTPSRRGATS